MCRCCWGRTKEELDDCLLSQAQHDAEEQLPSSAESEAKSGRDGCGELLQR